MCSGNVLFLNAVQTLQPRVQWRGRTGEGLLLEVANRPPRSLLLIATDDLLDLALQELLASLCALLQPARLRVVLFLEDQLDPERLQALLAAGVGVMCRLRHFQGSVLATAINNALRNRAWIDPHYDTPQRSLRQAGGPVSGGHAHPWALPPRERELLRQVGQGYNASEISHHLGIRCDTVRRSLSHLYRRIGVRDRAQAVGWCLCHGLISRQELQRRYRPPGGAGGAGSGGQGTPGASGASAAPDNAMRSAPADKPSAGCCKSDKS
ncbi:MAG: LuxR C-terminal-related transcriptional regulator [Cyanobium sp.]